MSDDKATAFGTTYAELYDRYLVPMLFAPYAEFVARRAANLHPDTVLETAAGTGIATQSLATMLPGASITATDLNQPMIDQAKAKADFRNVTWQQADAMNLSVADGCFDLVVCQFGVMFFPDKQDRLPRGTPRIEARRKSAVRGLGGLETDADCTISHRRRHRCRPRRL